MQAPADTWAQGAAYERYVGRWSREVAPRFLRWLDVPAGRRWIDVGCGTGALAAAILAHASPAALTGVDRSAGFLATARERLGDAALLHEGDATQLPLADAAADVVVTGLMLNFVPDHAAAVAEMVRVCVPGGTVAAYVWDYAGGMQFMRHFWDVATATDPRGAAIDEGLRFPICHPDALARLFGTAGLAAVATGEIVIDTRFADFDDFWRPFLGGQGAAPTYLATLDAAAQAAIREQLRARLPVAQDGTIALTARAWAVRGTVPG